MRLKICLYLKKVYNNKYMPLFCFILLMLLAHRFMYTNYGDDMVYTERMKGMSLWDAVVYGYNYNKDIFCRYLYGTFYYFIRKLYNGLFWRPVIALCYPVIAFSIFQIFDNNKIENKQQAIAIACCCIMYIPLSIMSETGWLSTSDVYVLPTAVISIACIGIKKSYKMEKIKWYEYIIYPLFMYVGTGHEQISALICGLSIILLLENLILKHKASLMQVVLFVISLIQTYRAATWPGNEARRLREAGVFFPNYYSLDSIDKIYLAYIETMKTIMTVYIVPFTLLSLLLCLIVWKKYSINIYRIIALIPILVMVVYGCKLPLIENMTSSISYTFVQTVNGSNFYNIQQYIGIFISFIFLCSICISIYLIFCNSFKSIFYIAVLLGGLCTRFIMGFSASLYASGSRTYFELFVCVIILIYILIYELYSMLSEKKKEYLVYTVIGLSLIVYVDLLTYI